MDHPVPDNEPTFKEREDTAGLPRNAEEQARDKVDGTMEAADAGVENAKENAKGVVQDAAAAGTGNGSAGPSGMSGASTGDGVNGDTVRDKAKEVDVEVAKERAKQSFKERLTGLRDRVPQQHRDKAHNLYDRAKTFWDEEYFPKERREQFIYRGKKVLPFILTSVFAHLLRSWRWAL